MAEDKGFEKIIERNGKSIYKIAFVYMKNRFDADDVYQEVLLRYLKYRPHFENCEHEKNWFVAVTINGRLRAKEEFMSLKELADNTESREISQDDTVMDALMQLDDDTRLIMQMYYYEGYSVKEISIMTKLKETSVYMRLSRGRKKMGRILSEW